MNLLSITVFLRRVKYSNIAHQGDASVIQIFSTTQLSWFFQRYEHWRWWPNKISIIKTEMSCEVKRTGEDIQGQRGTAWRHINSSSVWRVWTVTSLAPVERLWQKMELMVAVSISSMWSRRSVTLELLTRFLVRKWCVMTSRSLEVIHRLSGAGWCSNFTGSGLTQDAVKMQVAPIHQHWRIQDKDCNISIF